MTCDVSSRHGTADERGTISVSVSGGEEKNGFNTNKKQALSMRNKTGKIKKAGIRVKTK